MQLLAVRRMLLNENALLRELLWGVQRVFTAAPSWNPHFMKKLRQPGSRIYSKISLVFTDFSGHRKHAPDTGATEGEPVVVALVGSGFWH